MKCEEFMATIDVNRLSSQLKPHDKDELKRHLETCPKCDAEYEEMLHTAAVLESLPAHAPPPDLAARIQKRITKEYRRSRLALFAGPFARLLTAFKFNPHPALVNCAAMAFYLMLTVFLVKLTFFSESENPRHIAPPTASVWRSAHVITTSWATIRGISITIEETEPPITEEVFIQER